MTKSKIITIETALEELPEFDSKVLIELKFKDITMWLRANRRQWTLHRGRVWDEKREVWAYNGTSHFGLYRHLAHELAEELPRLQGTTTIKQMAKNMKAAHDWIKKTLKPLECLDM